MPTMRNEQDVAGGGQSARRKCCARGRRGAVAVEAAICLPILVAMMMAMWQIGQIAEMSRIVKDAAREGARVAAGGVNNGTAVTVANVQTAVQNFLTAAGMPSAAVNGATVTVTNLSTHTWTDPGNAQPLDQFSVTVTIPAGAPFNSLQFIGTNLCGVTQLQESVNWLSANDTQLTVSTTLPY
ncbi:MAG: TadE/TadG family type IV pilus assembly protein [Thermoguttaceae bacterium]